MFVNSSKIHRFTAIMTPCDTNKSTVKVGVLA